MRVLAFSDWRSQSIEAIHGVVAQIKNPVDMILYGGDDLGRFVEDDHNLLAELADHTLLGTVLAVRGNDDLKVADIDLDDFDDVPEVFDDRRVHDLHEAPFVHEEYVFLGLEGAIEGGPGLLLYSEAEIEAHLDEQFAGNEDKVPIVLSHVPPHGILDIGRRFGQRHIGSTSLRRFIESVEPVVTVCGHCHQFGGRATEEQFGTVINIASHDSPAAKGRYGVLELDGTSLDYELTTTEDGVDHHLFRLSQVGYRRVHHLLEAGITELDDFTQANRGILLDTPGVYDWHVDMWLEEVEAIRNGEFRVLDPGEFHALRSDDCVLLDIETDLSQERIWLIGLYDCSAGTFHQLFDKDDEKRLLAEFVEFLRDRDRPDIVYYGNNRFDEKCLKDRMQVHDLLEGVEMMEGSVDLGIKVHSYLLGDFTRTNLADLASTIADYEYAFPDIDGFDVGAAYTGYLLDDEEPDWEQLLAYNRDDVLALKAVVDAIRPLIRNE